MVTDKQKKLSKAWKASEKAFNNAYAKKIKEIVYECVDDFYDDYYPKMYNRKNDLMDVLVFEKTNGIYTNALLDENRLMKHRAENSYIYDITFHKGWHGGAIKGKDHPNPGVPYYRRPSPYFTEWGDLAVKTIPIFDEITKKIIQYNKTSDDLWNFILENELRKVGLIK